ncbi:ABC transporter substrate-binding protein [Nocardioides halotolerans]|uniref:ABC transporter substrate-binding protein n=1 Tax=Nocardioides halotolerans TaxID=433660 RepID=UPI00042A5583|nr:ABC transporter substrate-binding protein [Nocardioides halotolerans]
MTSSRRSRFAALAAATALTLGFAGCGGDGGGGGGAANHPQERTEATKGGAVFSLEQAVTQTLDPQRVYSGRDISYLGNLVYRSWVMFPPGATDTTEGSTPIPDLATDTGQSNEDATEWSFTVKDGPTWQDGKPVTCEDFKYGVSRTFATDVITGGPNYIIGYLDVPEDADGAPAYKGPYTGEGQDAFDQAVSCEGSTITYRFKKPWPDFPLAIAALRAFDPYRADQDKGDASKYLAFSSGPYMLDDKGWNEDSGGTFVRNPAWDGTEDTNREANPDTFTFEIGLEPEVIVDRLIADEGDDRNAITSRNVTPAQYPQISGDVADRAVNLQSPFSNYLVPNFNRLTNLKVRQALAAATDRGAYVGALGGDNASAPSLSIVNPATPGYVANPSFGEAEGGDVEGAKALLEESGETLPYPIKLTYPIGSDAFDKALAALKATYDEAGFNVTLDGLDPSGPYYDTVQKPGSDSDLIWGGWGADWPSVSTVIPPLFDSRINISKTSNGQDYGNYSSDEVNAAMDAASAETDLDKANEMWSEVDNMLAEDVAYIPLDITQFYFLHGSNIENYVNSVSSSGYADLGVISVKGGGA